MNEVNWVAKAGSAIDALTTGGPRPLWPVMDSLGVGHLRQEELADHLRHAVVNDPLHTHLHAALATWDADPGITWDPTEPTEPRTAARRASIYDRLGFETTLATECDRQFAIVNNRPVVISTVFEPWYNDARSARTSLYWNDYRRYLQDVRGWPVESVHTLDISTTEVLERLSDPCRTEAKKTRGLVVGYVQSGKTASFTGVAAKALDAGYRLVIVLTGTIEILRSQTQRRMDMELVGTENIIADQDLDDPDVRRELDYQHDEDWLQARFVTHGAALDQGHAPRIRRVTTHQSDYKTLPQGLTQLRYTRRNRQVPLNHAENLFATDAYLAVIKKNPAPLRKLIKDLRPLKKQLDDLPVLIIDDESDQASVNTTNPAASTAEAKKRTRINALISELMGLCPRAQYVGYTATPFANVFIDPDDNSDLFPADFLLTLPRTPGYMGVQQFHDVGRRWDDEEPTVATSNRLAHIRRLTGPGDDDPHRRDIELQQALDAYVLSGAIKKYRQAHGDQRFRHHTMLVHESMFKDSHHQTAAAVRRLWAQAQYTSGTGLNRLAALYEHDYAPVCAARAVGQPVPADFDELKPYVASAIAHMTLDADPVIVVNSDKDLNNQQKTLDFQLDPVWRILIGGTQLSRGFTVEGLTVSYFRRKALQADTLMQAGRWFGFRPGYQDLVRLYIRQDDQVDLYEAFEALLLDEEAFRTEIAQYAGFDSDGMPIVEPRQIPPLVSQHLPWLRPTARTKMWNAVIQQKATANGPRDFFGVPAHGHPDLRHNIHAAAPLIQAADTHVDLKWRRTEQESRQEGEFHARIGELPAASVSTVLHELRWHPQFTDTVNPTLAFIDDATARNAITEWALLWPQLPKVSTTVELPGHPHAQVISRTRRKPPRIDFVGSDRKHTSALEDLAAGTQGGLAPSTTRGAILISLVDDRADKTAPHSPSIERNEVALLLTLFLPPGSTPTRRDLIRWTVRSQTAAQALTVPAD